MNDEIKKILDDLLFTTTLPNVSIKLNKEKLNQLKDYISNLQHTEDLYNQLLKDYDELQQENEKWWAIIKDDEQEIKDLCLENSKLEQENERLKEQLFDFQQNIYIEKAGIPSKLTKDKTFMDLYDMPTYEDYKSRIEKAVEYLKNNCYIGDCINTYEAIDITNVMDILNGRSDE